MNISSASKNRTTGLLWTIGIAFFTLMTGQSAIADDTEIFFGSAGADPNNRPNVLLIIDSSGSMSYSVDGDTRDRLAVVQDVANDLIDTVDGVNMAIMKFDYDRNYYDDRRADGGMVVHAMSPIETNRTSLKFEVDEIHHYGSTPLQETYYESALYYLGEPVDYGKTSREGYRYWNGSQWKSSTRSQTSVSSSRNGTWTYDSPITGACQRNYIVYLTDGLPQRDLNGVAKIEGLLTDNRWDEHASTTCANPDGLTGGGYCLDELAEFLYKNDFDSTLPGKQNVISHFIGFDIDYALLGDAATAGGGEYHEANNAATLKDALTNILEEVTDESNGFTAPAVTVNAFDRTTHLDQLYFTVFQPNNGAHWDGNLKKYRFIPKDNDDGMVIVGQDGVAAVNPATGFFFDGRDATGKIDPNVPKAHSFWSPSPDGADVLSGGAAGLFSLARNIVTYPGFGSKMLMTHPIARDNPSMRGRLNSLPVGATGSPPTSTELDAYLDWAAGVDAFDADGDGDTAEARQIMGDPLHSKPAVVVYGGTADTPEVVLFVGTNDGLLHAFNGNSGEEYFAFMPKPLWDNINQLALNPNTTERPYGVDGPITVWKNDGGDGQIDASAGDFVYLYFGLRRGGEHTFALDVTDPTNPKYMWDFSSSNYAKMGQSWSQPTVAKISVGGTAKPVLVMGGGYDSSQDFKGAYSPDAKGNAIVMVDAVTGSLVWSASSSGATLNLDDMVSAIPAGVRVLDLNRDGLADRMYTNDIAGRVWRLDIHNDDGGAAGFRVSGGAIASLGGADLSGSANNRRFFYAPDVALGSDHGSSYINISAASGYRAHPLNKTANDYLFGVRDYRPFDLLGADPLTADIDYDYGITFDDLADISAGSGTIPPAAVGWKHALPASGEKSLARSRIFQNLAYYTSYTPGASASSNPCAPAVGNGKLYTIDLTTGVRRVTQLMKPGIPPEPTFIFGAGDEGNDGGDYCFGPHCDAPPPPPPPCDGPDCPDEDDDDDDGGRDIECLAGPESCDAGASEVPVRTFWRQLEPGN